MARKRSANKGAAKVRLLLDHDGYLPCFACITDGKTSDIQVARQFQFAPGTVVVMDCVEDGDVLILRVVHGRRDLEALFGL